MLCLAHKTQHVFKWVEVEEVKADRGVIGMWQRKVRRFVPLLKNFMRFLSVPTTYSTLVNFYRCGATRVFMYQLYDISPVRQQ